MSGINSVHNENQVLITGRSVTSAAFGGKGYYIDAGITGTYTIVLDRAYEKYVCCTVTSETSGALVYLGNAVITPGEAGGTIIVLVRDKDGTGVPANFSFMACLEVADSPSGP